MPKEFNKYFKYLDKQDKKTRTAIYISAASLLLFIVIALTLPFRNTLYNNLFPKGPGQAAQPANSLNIVNYGATPNDGSDDTAAIENALSDARSQGKIVYVPSGRFNHGRFTIDSVRMTGEGDSSVLHAPDENELTIFLEGDGPALTNMKVTAAHSERGPTNYHSIWANFATNYEISHVTVDGSKQVGIFSYGASNGVITDNYVVNTLADAIHNTHGAHDIYIARNTVRNAGDDNIAVVSYNDGQCNVGGDDLAYNILIENNDVGYQTHARGIAVVGGKDVTIRNNEITRSSSAGIYISAESSYNTCSVENIKILNNNIRETNQSGNHPSVLIYADAPGQSIERVYY